eukprot:jgi/Mesvir1/27470/Mv26389-RA.1
MVARWPLMKPPVQERKRMSKRGMRMTAKQAPRTEHLPHSKRLGTGQATPPFLRSAISRGNDKL